MRGTRHAGFVATYEIVSIAAGDAIIGKASLAAVAIGATLKV